MSAEQTERIRRAAADAHTALQQLTAATAGLTPEGRTVLLDALHDGKNDGLLVVLAGLITATGEDLPEGDAAEDIDEAAAYVEDYAGQRLHRARTTLTEENRT
ncbi:hypothetical protein [Streptomyces rubiginosohelvolus]|uniref:Uncharacterized protein n=1 Tax=Streptomyces rubiginosohelvolus TaxID=67362 RepID=A0ABQ3CCS6_9ACTN|nr:hypothetical protein [Streptomyces pluricolorescens]GGZ83768.1 hypothetical protein GCM10010328_67490 [Streptomyces pluricolorescens]